MADEVLTIGVELENRAATQSMLKFQREVSKQLAKVTQAVNSMGKANAKVAEKAADDTDEWSESLGDLAKYYQHEIQQVKSLEKALDRAEKARGSGDKKAQKDAEKRIDILKKEISEHQKLLKREAGVESGAGKMGSEAKEAASRAAKEFSGSLKSFFSRDLKGVISGGGGLAAGLTEGLSKGLASGAGKAGTRLSAVGGRMGRAGAARGGAGGMAMRGAGGAMRGIGSLAKSVGPLVRTLSSFGPILGAAASGLMSVVQILIDADAKAKEFQKGLLESSSTIEILADSGWNADLAFSNLKDTVKEVRDAAFDASFNLDWGITADTHREILTTLTKEGLSWKRIEAEAKMADKTVGEFSQSLVGVSLGYARAFGVPISEINQQQAEFMTEMGMNLQETEMAFSHMARAATESGISSNKFFSMIRGVSQDLSLYNVRIGETAKLLSKLGKVMNPRNAQKFMQTAVKGLKDMGRMERMKVTMLAGAGKVGAIVDRDMNRKTKILSRKLKMDSDEVSKILRTQGAKGLSEAISKLPKEAQGAVTEMATKLQLQMTRRKKGAFGISGAAADVGPGAALEIIEKAVSRFTGGKNLEDAVGELGTEMIAENLGISQDELDQRIQFKLAMDVEREKMTALLKKQASGQELNKEETERLKAMTEAGMTDSDKIAKAGYDELFDAMTDSAKSDAEMSGKVIDYGKMQGELTQSVLEKLSVLVDFVMNQIYNVMLGIWDAVTVSLTDLSGAKQLAIDVARTKDPAMTALLESVGGDPELFKKALNESDATKRLNESLPYLESSAGATQRLEEIEAEMSKAAKEYRRVSMGTEAATAYEAKLVEEQKSLREALKNAASGRGSLDKLGGALEGKNLDYVSSALEAGLKNAGIQDAGNESRSMAIDIKSGIDIAKVLGDQGRTPEQIKDIIEGLPLELRAAMLSGGTEKQEEDAKKSAEDASITAKESAATSKATTTLTEKATHEGTLFFKMPRSTLNGEYKDAVHDAVLKAFRMALFEYYMYSDLDRESVVKTMKAGGWSVEDFAKRAGEESVKEGSLISGRYASLKGGAADPEKVKGRQFGGMVHGISGSGLAIIRPPQGEGMAAVKPGERIVPGYGGGGGGGGSASVSISLSPDAQKLIQAEVKHGIYEHSRRTKTTGP